MSASNNFEMLVSINATIDLGAVLKFWLWLSRYESLKYTVAIAADVKSVSVMWLVNRVGNMYGWLIIGVTRQY